MNCMKAVWVAAMLACLAFSARAIAAPLLKDGDRIVFIGDSITEQQIYTRYVMDYFALRYPGSTIHFRNRGIAGAPATFTQGTYDNMMKTCRPTVATICFGMNDGHYKPFESKAYDAYVASMTQWVSALKKDRVRVLLLTPGCVDESRKPALLASYNETLRRLAEGTKAVGVSEGIPVFDLHAAMLDVQSRAKGEDPAFCMIPDGVHPGPPGHVLMAIAVLKLLECTDPPSSLDIDTGAGSAVAERCQVTDLKISADTVTFTRADDALPTYFDLAAAAVFKYYALPPELNDYRLRVRGLATGTWKLAVAGKALASFSADQLAIGVDLSALPGPWAALGGRTDSMNAGFSARYYQAWRGFSPIHFPRDVEPERLALVERLLELLDSDEAAARIPQADRTWPWSLTRQK
jgi:lysophospholipase L1-like esterase